MQPRRWVRSSPSTRLSSIAGGSFETGESQIFLYVLDGEDRTVGIDRQAPWRGAASCIGLPDSGAAYLGRRPPSRVAVIEKPFVPLDLL